MYTSRTCPKSLHIVLRFIDHLEFIGQIDSFTRDCVWRFILIIWLKTEFIQWASFCVTGSKHTKGVCVCVGGGGGGGGAGNREL